MSKDFFRIKKKSIHSKTTVLQGYLKRYVQSIKLHADVDFPNNSIFQYLWVVEKTVVTKENGRNVSICEENHTSPGKPCKHRINRGTVRDVALNLSRQSGMIWLHFFRGSIEERWPPSGNTIIPDPVTPDSRHRFFRCRFPWDRRWQCRNRR